MSLSKRQREALKNNSPSPDDILGNGGFVKELNEEIESNYDQALAQDLTAQTGEEVSDFDYEKDFDMSDETTVDESIEDFEIESDLDAELAAMKAKLEAEKAKQAAEAPSEAAEQPEMTQEEMVRRQILETLHSRPGAPTPRQLQGLKKKYGEHGVQVVAFGEEDVYIFTHLRRGQWKKIQEVVSTMAQSAEMAGSADNTLKEKVVQNCVLWPKAVRDMDAKFVHNSRAGLIDSLFELIMLHSYFLTTQQTMTLTVSL